VDHRVARVDRAPVGDRHGVAIPAGPVDLAGMDHHRQDRMTEAPAIAAVAHPKAGWILSPGRCWIIARW
jgi:hypothetical protein